MCGRPLAYIRVASPSPSQNSCKTMSEEFSAPVCAGDGDAHGTAQPSSLLPFQPLDVFMTKLRGLIQIARDTYRPELHYMRGPGPKWYAKHQARIDQHLANFGG